MLIADRAVEAPLRDLVAGGAKWTLPSCWSAPPCAADLRRSSQQ
jgi:hypothetical protein